MGRLGWTIAVLLMWVVVSCAGRSIVGIDVAPVQSTAVQTEQITEPLARSFNVSSLNGQGEYRIIEQSANGKLFVSIVACSQVSTTALLLEITYDSASSRALVVHLADKLLGLPDALVLESTGQSGKVGLGVVPISGQPIAFSEGETVAQIMFEPASGSAGSVIRSASDVPASANAVVPLIWDEDEEELRWYLVNPGDYDQNGEVGLSDLMPLAVHFGEAGPFEYTLIQAVIDGNGDGEINLQDITPIAQGFGNTVEGYNLYASDNIADIPRGYTEPSVIDPVATFRLAEADNASAVADERLSFSYIPNDEQQELMFWARPFETSHTGDISEGTRSNINGPTISQNPDPGGPDFNFAPVASLSLELLGTHTPLEVLLDGSASHDPDGYIAFYEWDFEGDGLVDAYSTDPVIAHTYNNPGTFSPTLIVTDNHGSRDTFASPAFTATRDEVTNIEPFADLYATEYSGLQPLTVGLIATGSSDVDGYIANYAWDFDGDGTVDLDSGMDPTVMHTYDGHGVFACRVTVTDDAGASAFAEVEIEVISQYANGPPLTFLTADPTYGDEGVLVTLDASGSYDYDGEIVKYEWDFNGDGSYDSYGTSNTASHAYNSPGLFFATVRATDDGGEFNVASAFINVNEPVDLSIPWQSNGRDRRNSGQSPYVGAQTNNLKWARYFENLAEKSIAIGNDGTMYIALPSYGEGGGLGAIDPDGIEKWFFATSSSASSPAIGPDGTVYFGNFGDSLFAINPDGSLKWSYDANSSGASPAIGADGTVYVGSRDDKLYAINPDGTLKWSYITEDPVYSSPAIGADGTVYAGSRYKLHAIHQDGTEKWSHTPGGRLYSSPAIGVDGTVYVGSRDANLYAINPDGTLKWSFTTGSWVASPPAIGNDGTVYVGSYDYKLYAINPDGTLKWSYTTGNYVESSPVIGNNSTVYVGSYDGKLYAINPDGTLNWSYTMGGPMYSPLAIGADGTVYVAGWDDKLYAFGEGKSPIAAVSASPTFGHIPINVDFDASGSYDPDGTIVDFEWDFDGDGVYDVSGPASTVSYTYTEGGIFDAQVRVTDDEGFRGAAKVEIMILGPGVWGYQAIDSTNEVGTSTSLAVVDEKPAVVYYDSTNNALMFIRATDARGITWGAPQTIDSSGASLGYSSLAVVDGSPAVSYYNYTTQDLVYLRATNADGSSWGTPQTVDSTGNVGKYSSMTVVDGNPAISYFDDTNHSLKFIRATNAEGSNWGTPQTIDSTGYIGWSTSLAVVNGHPAISYYAYGNTNKDLRYVRATNASGSSWGGLQTIDSSGDVGMSTSLAVVDGNPAISYWDNTNEDLKYIRAEDANGLGWESPQILDSNGVVGSSSSLCVVDGKPAISYWDFTKYNLKYIQATDASGGAWNPPLTLDSTGSVGLYNSLAVVDGSPAISYYDSTNHDLKFARLY